jgi:hypothetical protein
MNFELVDCCIDNAYYANVSFNGYFHEDVNDFIVAGEDAFGNAGSAVVTANSNVTFHAGGYITLLPGFTVNPGGIYEGIISDCIYGSTRAMTQKQRQHTMPRASGTLASMDFLAFPNPFEDELTIDLPAALGSDGFIEIFNASGQVVITEVINARVRVNISTNGLASGVYALRVHGVNEVWSRTLLKE